MAHSRLAVLLLVLCAIKTPLASRAQDLTEPNKQQQEALQKVQNLLAEEFLETKNFQMNMPLAKFLEAVERQFPKDKRIKLRIDKDAFGDKYAEVAALPTFMPTFSTKTSVRAVLDWSSAKSKTKIDYRLEETGIAITTRERALCIIAYDIRDLVAKANIVGLTDPAFRNADQAKRAVLLVKKVLSDTDPLNDKPTADRESIRILDGARLVIRATGTRHAEFAQAFLVYRRIGDLAVATTARLYEVDDAFYTKLKNAKYVPLEELERLFIEGKAPKGESLFDRVAKQKPIMVGQDIKVDVGHEATLLSRHDVVRCLPSPGQVRKGDKTRQTILEGVSFTAVCGATWDRRFVSMKFTEAARGVERIQKTKVLISNDKEVDAEIAHVREAAHTRTLEIPDGGSMLVPVHYRPRAAREKNRWWVLSITSRFVMEEEERRIKAGAK